MNSPLSIYLFKNKFPQDIINKIQSYIKNDIIYQAINQYFNYLYDKKFLYENFALVQYITPNCRCSSYFNTFGQRFKTRDCSICELAEYTDVFVPLDFKLCIMDNTQYYKIMNNKTIDECIHDNDDESIGSISDYHYDNQNKENLEYYFDSPITVTPINWIAEGY